MDFQVNGSPGTWKTICWTKKFLRLITLDFQVDGWRSLVLLRLEEKEEKCRVWFILIQRHLETVYGLMHCFMQTDLLQHLSRCSLVFSAHHTGKVRISSRNHGFSFNYLPFRHTDLWEKNVCFSFYFSRLSLHLFLSSYFPQYAGFWGVIELYVISMNQICFGRNSFMY